MNKTSSHKFKFRLLPIFIFMAVLSLTIKVSSTYNMYKETFSHNIKIVPVSAVAKDALEQETDKLNKLLQKENQKNAKINPPSFTNSEIAILQELAERREALDIRSQEIDKRALQLKVAEEEIDKKIVQLKEYEQRLNKLISQYSQKEQENVSSLVKLYTSMKPKDAARIFNTMNLDISTAILKGMKPSASSAILSQMNSEKAQAITAELIGNNL